MDKIIKDYRRFSRITAIPFDWLRAALVTAVFTLTGMYTRSGFRIAAIILTAGMVGISLYATLNALIFTEFRFKKRMSALSEKERSDIANQYDNAVNFGYRWFLEEYLLYFTNTNIALLKYSEILSVELKRSKLLLRLSNGKTAKMDLSPNDNPAVLVAAMRSKNPDISVMIDGKVVESMENKK
ncbi:MAG: hypothetical protein K2N06_06865 [Oscillospiraceae bacterium]|nr:hypothetical protein [Oscillospiraceae bacterium]